MENEPNALVPVPNKTGMIALELRLHSVADNIAMANKTFHDATDKMLKVRSETVVGFASLTLTFTLLAVGSILLGPTPAGIAAGFSYFPWVGPIAFCCALMSALIIQHKSSFDGGELSFRSVLIWMYCSTSLVCDGAAVYVHGGLTAQPSWADPVTVNWYLMCGTIATLCFALLYVLYARNITMDRIRMEGTTAVAGRHAKRSVWSDSYRLAAWSGIQSRQVSAASTSRMPFLF